MPLTVALILAAIATIWLLANAGVIPQSFRELRWSLLRRSPAGETASPVPDESFVSLNRTGCFGKCPIYQVTVYASGRVEYAGKGHVCELGPRTALIDSRLAAKLISDLKTAGYFEIDWKPGPLRTDFPTILTRLSTAGNTRTISDDHGDEGVPRVLRRFEDTIDEVAGTDRWLRNAACDDR